MTEKIIDRVVKLHRHAESAKQIGNEAEALAFSEMIQRLLLKHKLSMSDIDFSGLEKSEPIQEHWIDYRKYPDIKVRRQGVAWIRVLGNVVAQGHMCDCIWVENSSKITFIGRKSDCEVAEFMLITLQRLAEKLADKAYRKYFYECKAAGDVTLARGYRTSFLTGFVRRLKERYDEALSAEVTSSGETGLVRINRIKLDLKDFNDKNYANSPTAVARTNARHGAGWRDGRKAADGVNLGGKAVGAGSAQNSLRP